MFENRIERCRYSVGDIKRINNEPVIEYYCRKSDEKICDEVCQKCEQFSSRFIEYPIVVNELNIKSFEPDSNTRKEDIGKFVEIRPCNSQYENKTYLGIFLGYITHAPHITYSSEKQVLNISPMDNPAIFVPELKKIIFGYESWWRIIPDGKDMKEITDTDINNTWYVKIANKLFDGG